MSAENDLRANSALIGKGATFNGTIIADGMVVINGSYEGEIEANRVEIGIAGEFNGKAVANDFNIQGKCGKDITAKKTVHIHKTGKITGSVKYREIDLDRGAIVNANLEIIP
jgi:cytoskeletal protein CcmA (bactofilin family)